MSCYDYKDRTDLQNSFTYSDKNQTNTLQLSHDFDIDINIEFGSDEDNKSTKYKIKAGLIKRKMMLNTKVSHKWENITEHKSSFFSDAEGAFTMYDLPVDALMTITTGNTYQTRTVLMQYPTNNPQEEFEAQYLSSWIGTYTENFEYAFPEVRFIDAERKIVFYHVDHYKISGEFNSQEPVGWCRYQQSEKGFKTLWNDCVAFRDSEFNVIKISKNILWIDGYEYILFQEESNWKDKYDIIGMEVPASSFLPDWYNLATYDMYPDDKKGDGRYWSSPRWLFGEDGSRKYIASWIDDIMMFIGNTDITLLKLSQDFISPFKVNMLALNPNCLGSFCVSKLDSNPNEDEQTRHLLYSCQTQNGYKTQIAKLSKEGTRLEFKDLIDYLTTDQKEHIPCYPICPL